MPSRKLAVLYFAEPSTRTRISFASALTSCDVPYEVVAEHECKVSTGETLDDTLRVIAAQSGLLVLRHHEADAAHQAVAWGVPVISAGCGTRHHPTQSLVDAYTLRERRGHLEGLSIALVGNLASRAARSLIDLLSLYGVENFYLVSHDELLERFEGPGRRVTSLFDVPPDVDFVYWVRHKGESATAHTGPRMLSPGVRSHFSPGTMFMHPLPRGSEVPVEADRDPRALYWRQVVNAPYVRAACVRYCLAETPMTCEDRRITQK